MRTKKSIYTEFLPSTPCTTQMREQLVNIARSQGVSIAEIQRNAYALFLAKNVSDSHINVQQANKILESEGAG